MRTGLARPAATALTIAAGPSGVPVMTYACQAALDVGCGENSTLEALDLPEGALRVGVDVKRDAVKTLAGRTSSPIHVVVASGEALPFRAGVFALVTTRVAIPYMNVPVALREAGRVLRADGQVWMMLHPLRIAALRILSDLRALRLKDVLYQTYAILNGVALHGLGKQFRFPFNRRRIESVQTLKGMARALAAAGFCDVQSERRSRGAGYEEADRTFGELFTVVARKGRSMTGQPR